MTTTISPRLEAERVRRLLVDELQRRFTYTAKDNHVQTVAFRGAALVEDTFLLLEVDCSRIPRRWTVGDMDSPDMLAHLSAVCGHKVQKLNSVGLTYAVRLTPKERRRLPATVELRQNDMPAGLRLGVPVGVGYDGPVWLPLGQFGHALVTGATRSGKSSWLHAAMASLLAHNGPEALRLALVDPKRVEFVRWAYAPHLIGEVAHDETGALTLVDGLLVEMEKRGDLLAGAQARNLDSYNREAAEPLPYVLLVVDEVLDLALSSGGEKGDLMRMLASLTAKGASLGLITWYATQHARYDLLPRAISLNLASRLVFRVEDRSAAQLAGCLGAERIPRDKPGRLLFKYDGRTAPLQGYWLPEDTLNRLARSLGKAPSGPRLTEDERRAVEVALRLGAFHINGIYEALGPKSAGGVSRDWLKKTAQAWERKGWLGGNPSNPTEARKIGPELAGMVRGSVTGGGGIARDALGDVGAQERE